MANYTYKDLCYRIPAHIEQQFKDEQGIEPDGDPNYNGDCWTLAAMWVSELEQNQNNLILAIKTVLHISDRDHDAWNKVKDLINQIENV